MLGQAASTGASPLDDAALGGGGLPGRILRRARPGEAAPRGHRSRTPLARLTGRMSEPTLKQAIGAALVGVGLAIGVEAAF
jgi:hypothetical protein